MNKGLTFDDVLMPPKWSDIKSREECQTTSYFSRNVKLSVPIVSANMRTVTGAEMCIAMNKSGGLGILHRNFESRVDWIQEMNTIRKAYPNDPTFNRFGISIGINMKFDPIPIIERLNEMWGVYPCVVVIDVANAANQHVFEFTERVCKEYHSKPIDIVVGNIATADAAARYKELPIDGLKVGVGPGAACTTRIMTGCGVPQFTAIQDISRVLRHSDITLIADGGIQQPGHAAIALAAGADCVMMGKVLAYAMESPGWVNDGQFPLTRPHWIKTYQGEASFRQDRSPEGVKHDITLPPLETPESVSLILDRYKDYIQSSMSYQNARTIEHFQENATFVEVSTNTLIENRPRY